MLRSLVALSRGGGRERVVGRACSPLPALGELALFQGVKNHPKQTGAVPDIALRVLSVTDQRTPLGSLGLCK